MGWKPASELFQGGTAQARALTGKRVRTRTTLHTTEFAGAESPPGPPLTVEPGSVGFVGHPVGDSIIIAFPHGATAPATLDQLLRTQFRAIRCNSPTFRFQFEVEV